MANRKNAKDRELNGVRNRAGGLVGLPPKFFKTLVSMAFVVLIGLFLLWRGGSWILNELVYENSMFAIQRIKISTDGMIASEHYRTWTGIHEGDNVFELDLSRVKRDLESISWVQNASVRRILPDTVSIEITEREPVATMVLTQVDAERGGYSELMCQVDSEGFISRIPRDYINPNAKRIDYRRLPQILPYEDTVLRQDRLSGSAQIKEALLFLNEFNRSALCVALRIKSIDLSEAGYMKVMTSTHQEVLLASGDYQKQLARWGSIAQMAWNRGKEITFLDLSVGNRLPLKLKDMEFPSENETPGRTRPANGSAETT